MVTRGNNLIFKMVVAVFAVTTISSCIKNDTPPPTVKGIIKEFGVEGQKSVSYDTYTRRITVDLKETVNPKEVRINKVVLGDTAVCDLAEGQVIDLSSPVSVKVKTVAEYEWTISATQTIERRFVIDGQVGEAYFEVLSRKAFAYVPRGTDLTKVTVTDLKLGPGESGDKITEMIPNLNGKPFHNAGGVRHREVDVKYHGGVEKWSLFITEADTQLNTVSPFARKVYLVGYGQEGLENGFQYKKYEAEPVAKKLTRSEDEEEGEEPEVPEDPEGWITVPEADITHNKGVFSTWIKELDPETEYVVRAYSGSSRSTDRRFVTESPRELPGGGFEDWHLVKKSIITGEVSLWNPWVKKDDPAEEKATQWWDTGNPGATTLGNSNSVPAGSGTTAGHGNLTGCPDNTGGKFAYLKTEFVGIGTTGKVAGGNIYLGRYFGTSGVNGKCDIGIPWQTRPTRLKGWYQYYPQVIKETEYIGKLHEHEKERWKNTTDSLNVTIALWAPQKGDPYYNNPKEKYDGEMARGFVVNTDPKNFRDFTKDEPGVIAFGAFATDQAQDGWAEFDIELKYYNYDPLPENTVLFLLATSSKNCNYFTAAGGSLMYLDELTLEYD